MTDNCALSSTLGLLAHLSIDELKEVLNDDDRFENMTRDANIVVCYQSHNILVVCYAEHHRSIV